MINGETIFQLSQAEAYKKKLPEPDLVYVIDFFSGCGGMSWGFANTRQSHMAFKVLAGIDIEEPALKTYEKNIGSLAIRQDIGKIAEEPTLLEKLIPDFNPEKCRPLVFIGCAPCQGFSAHRKKDERDDPRNNLMVAFANICEHYKPDVIVMENVPEILKGRYDNYWQDAARILEKCTYKLKAEILDLSLFGVPQRRKRAVVVGSLKGEIHLPPPLFGEDRALTVRHAISHLEPIEAGQGTQYDIFHRAPSHTERILERIKKTPIDGGDRRSLKIEDQLDCHVNVDSSKTPGFTDVYGRLRWNTPSVTITAKSSTPSCGRFLHPEQNRNISVREAAILQGFPQHYVFEGPMVSQYRQIGEAVPPLFSRFLAWEVLNFFRPKSVAKIEFKKKSDILSSDNTSNNKIDVVDCFSGSGGLSLGFEFAGYRNALAFDISADAIETFKRNISKKAIVANVEDKDLSLKIADNLENDQFIVVGGPPCQGFSQQRRGDNNDIRNNLVISYANLIESFDTLPRAVVLENVTYIDSPRGRKILSEYIHRLEKLGYKTFRHNMNSADYLVPQLRRRIIIVSILKEYSGRYKGPVPITPNRWVTVGEVLSSLPEFGLNELSLSNHEPSNEGELNKRRVAYVDMGRGRLSVPNFLQLDCHKEYEGHLDVYGRLDWFSFARTITGGFDSFTRGEYGHPFFHRSITPREAARIQGFPDWFDFVGNRASVRKQIGNAVPPPMAHAIAKSIKEAVSVPSKILSCL